MHRLVPWAPPGASSHALVSIRSPYHSNLLSTLSASILALSFKFYWFIPPCLVVPPAPSTPRAASHFIVRHISLLSLLLNLSSVSLHHISFASLPFLVPKYLILLRSLAICTRKGASGKKKKDGAETDVLICKFSSETWRAQTRRLSMASS